MTRQIPERVGDYRIDRVLGRGGMGVVYAGVCARTGAAVAIKTVFIADDRFTEPIRREIHALARLRHPGIVDILEEGIDGGLPWYAMPLLAGVPLAAFAAGLRRDRTVVAPVGGADARDGAGGTSGAHGAPGEVGGGGETGRWWTSALSDYAAPSSSAAPQHAGADGGEQFGRPAAEPLSTQDMLPPQVRAAVWRQHELRGVLRLLVRLCDALAYLHGEGIVHRDLKPANILVCDGGLPVIVDFGIAAQYGTSESRELLELTHPKVGTLAYMAPEQIVGGVVDARADLYALGCLLYELLTGRTPFVADTELGIVGQHLHRPPLPPSDLTEELPEGMDELVMGLLAKRREDRFGYAMDVARILTGMLAGEGGDGGAPPRAVGTRPKVYLYRPRLHGRNPVLERIRDEVAQLGGTRGSMFLVEGPRGIGKTRMVNELAERAAAGSFWVLRGICVPGRSNLQGNQRSAAPLHPFKAVLLAVADRFMGEGPEAVAAALGDDSGLLALFEPALARAVSAAEGPSPLLDLPPQLARTRLYRALARTLEAASRCQPVFLAIDDLEWADELTIGFLQHLLGTNWFADHRLVLACARTREDSRASRSGAAEELAAGAVVIALGPLGAEDVIGMIGDMLAMRPAPAQLGTFVAQQSGGVPFFVAEYLLIAVSAGVLYRDDGGRWQVRQTRGPAATGAALYATLPLPRTLAGVIASGLARLSPAARTVLEVAAVIGGPTSEQLVAAVADLPLEETRAAISEALGCLMLEELANGRIRIAHERVLRALYGGLEADRRAAYHRRVAALLQERLPAALSDALAELANHHELGGNVVEARAWFARAGRELRRRYALRDAEVCFAGALRCADGDPAEAVRLRCELATEILWRGGEAQRARRELTVAAAAARKLQDPTLVSSCLYSLAGIAADSGDLANALKRCRGALRAARAAAAPAAEARCVNLLAVVQYQLGNAIRARTLYLKALALYRSIGGREGEAMVLGNLGNLDLDAGRFARARRVFRRALEVHRELEDPAGEGLALGSLGLEAYCAGRLGDARAKLEDGLSLLRQIGQSRDIAITLTNLANVYRDTGFWEEAAAAYDEALARSQELGDLDGEAAVRVECARFARLGCGDGRRAEAELEVADSIYRRIHSPLGLIRCLCERGHALLARGASSVVCLDEASTLARQLGIAPEGNGDVARKLAALRAAQSAWQARRWENLRHGELAENVPPGLLAGMATTGPPPPDRTDGDAAG